MKMEARNGVHHLQSKDPREGSHHQEPGESMSFLESPDETTLPTL
jgi:hypothetical protein